jgi:hypothetical protein
MHRHSTHTASLFSVLINVLIFSLCLAGVAAAQGNTSLGTGTLQHNITGSFNTAIGLDALFSNTTRDYNTASGLNALLLNSTSSQNTASGSTKGLKASIDLLSKLSTVPRKTFSPAALTDFSLLEEAP